MINYVYTHKERDEIVYVGVGTKARAWWHGNRSHLEHRKWMENKYDNGAFDFVTIVEKGLSRLEALELEDFIIREVSPRFNRTHTAERKAALSSYGKRNTNNTRQVKVKTPDGVFNTLKEAAEYYGVNQTTVRRRCNRGVVGWKALCPP